jgi:type I restriction enzyme, R subunit
MLKEEETKKFVHNALRDGFLKTTGTDIDRILPAVTRFSKNASRTEKKNSVIEKLVLFFEKVFWIIVH